MTSPDPNHAPLSIADRIANRNSWLKVGTIGGCTLAVCLFFVGIGFKILNGNFDFSKFDFSDLLSLILALFSIALSVAFYFKAADDSAKFYDNTYKFTKEISEILGRIDAGFGEKLNNLDANYSTLHSSIAQLPLYDANKASKEVQDTKADIDKIVQEKDRIIDDLFKKAQLTEMEGDELRKRLMETDKALQEARSIVSTLEAGIASSKGKEDEAGWPDKIDRILLRFTKMLSGREVLRLSHGVATDGLKLNFIHFFSELSAGARTAFVESGICLEDGQLTSVGIRRLSHVAWGQTKM